MPYVARRKTCGSLKLYQDRDTAGHENRTRREQDENYARDEFAILFLRFGLSGGIGQ
jgi:hypothetical protein